MCRPSHSIAQFPPLANFGRRRVRLIGLMSGLLSLLLLGGCSSSNMRVADGGVPASVAAEAAAQFAQAPSTTLREGDVIKLTFPTASNLDTQLQIRRDGKVALPIVGEVQAAGLEPVDLERRLMELYSTELVSGEVFVSVVSSSYPIFVTGAVVRPGKIEADRPMTALEAIMEAGGFEMTKANGEQVVIVRHGEKGVRNFTLNLREVLEGRSRETFYLQPSDIVYVPERFAWF